MGWGGCGFYGFEFCVEEGDFVLVLGIKIVFIGKISFVLVVFGVDGGKFFNFVVIFGIL